jgi:hypothetical protein
MAKLMEWFVPPIVAPAVMGLLIALAVLLIA